MRYLSFSLIFVVNVVNQYISLLWRALPVTLTTAAGGEARAQDTIQMAAQIFLAPLT